MVDMGMEYEDDRCGSVVVAMKISVETGRACNRFRDSSRCVRLKLRDECPLGDDPMKCRCTGTSH